jgi:hypothetical protein
MKINNSRTDFDAADLPTSPLTQVETSSLLPALLLSVLLNFVTGGHILMSNIKASKRGDTAMSGGMTDFLPTIKENLPKIDKIIFRKEGWTAFTTGSIAGPAGPAAYVCGLWHAEWRQLLSKGCGSIFQWGGPAMKTLNYKETNRESVKIDRRGGGKQKHKEYKDGSKEHRFTNPHIQDTYY